jgi:hypothetical protein
MTWRARANRAVGRLTGLELRRVADRPHARRTTRPRASKRACERLLDRPIFVYSSMRSGSTLLRVLLDSHSQLHAPHELHLRNLRVQMGSKHAAAAMGQLGLSTVDLEYLLWDRVLHVELQRSGKRYIVNKTPGNAFIWRRIAACWPDARFIFLLRHPGATAISWHKIRSSWTLEEAALDVARYMKAVEAARQALPGMTIRYEDLTADPEAVTRQICHFLDLDWEPEMLDYGKHDHGAYVAGLGDWGQRIKSGEIQSARPLPRPEEIPEVLRDLCVAWGYLEMSTVA